MSTAHPRVTILRHYKERLAKCSLRGLEARGDFTFRTIRPGLSFDAGGHTLLTVEAPVLTPADAVRPLLLLDSTWRLLPQLEAALTGTPPVPRSLPRGLVTAYPRTSKISEDPAAGLASVEALYAALRLLGHDDPTLLDDYYWRDEFLATCDEVLG